MQQRVLLRRWGAGQGLPSNTNSPQDQASQRNGAFTNTEGHSTGLFAGALERWGPGRGGWRTGVRGGRNWAVLHGDLAALISDPHASGSWVLVGLNLPPPGLGSFVSYLCCHILRRPFCVRLGAEGFCTFSHMCSQQPLNEVLSLMTPIGERRSQRLREVR